MTKALVKIRYTIQAISFIFLANFALYGLFRCPFAVPFVGCGNCPVLQCPGRKYYLPLWIAFFMSSIVLFRSFCGWICPVGTFSTVLNKIASKLNLIKITISKKSGTILQYLSYLFLAAAVLLVFVYSNPRWAIPIRTGELFNSIKLTFAHANNPWIIRTLVIAALIGIGLFSKKIWCRFICPAGLISKLIGTLSIFKIKKDAQCQGTCNQCDKYCDMDAMHDNGNCISCATCFAKCPQNKVTFSKIKF